MDQALADVSEKRHAIRIERPAAVAGPGRPEGSVGFFYGLLLFLSYIFSLTVFVLAGLGR